ncbi:hypothetical protein CYMTET_7308 [Cymbomonas tetramitiformis]|uniref:Uncharacterized protein n=1 Tax=Cymbomonas tetramitiformis TaxID=36881 RepID=A0AAE0GVW9_9CHLO|nr:hypothetical protein CYMTET_7308 [Cymbomonas tetramitiformis]
MYKADRWSITGLREMIGRIETTQECASAAMSEINAVSAAELARVKHSFGRHPARRVEPWEFELLDSKFPACRQEQCGLEELPEGKKPSGSDGEDSESEEKKRAAAKARFGSLRTATDEELRRALDGSLAVKDITRPPDGEIVAEPEEVHVEDVTMASGDHEPEPAEELLEELAVAVERYQDGAYAESTQRSYDTGVKAFLTFCVEGRGKRGALVPMAHAALVAGLKSLAVQVGLDPAGGEGGRVGSQAARVDEWALRRRGGRVGSGRREWMSGLQGGEVDEWAPGRRGWTSELPSGEGGRGVDEWAPTVAEVARGVDSGLQAAGVDEWAPGARWMSGLQAARVDEWAPRRVDEWALDGEVTRVDEWAPGRRGWAEVGSRAARLNEWAPGRWAPRVARVDEWAPRWRGWMSRDALLQESRHSAVLAWTEMERKARFDAEMKAKAARQAAIEAAAAKAQAAEDAKAAKLGKAVAGKRQAAPTSVAPVRQSVATSQGTQIEKEIEPGQISYTSLDFDIAENGEEGIDEDAAEIAGNTL